MGVMFVTGKRHSLLAVESEKITEVKYNTLLINDISEAEYILTLIDELFDQLNKDRDKLFVKIYLNSDKESVEYLNNEKRNEIYDIIKEDIEVKEFDEITIEQIKKKQIIEHFYKLYQHYNLEIDKNLQKMILINLSILKNLLLMSKMLI